MVLSLDPANWVVNDLWCNTAQGIHGAVVACLASTQEVVGSNPTEYCLLLHGIVSYIRIYIEVLVMCTVEFLHPLLVLSCLPSRLIA